MTFIAITRLRIRALRFMPAFLWYTWQSHRQAQRAPGNLGVKLHKSHGLTFWTLTAWQDEDAMKAYRVAKPHRDAMPKLLNWCDEATVANWHQETGELPDWITAAQRMAASGRLSKVRRPSSDQLAGRLDYREELKS